MSGADLAKSANHTLAETIDAAFERREEIGPATKGAVREAVESALGLLDRGAARVAEKAPTARGTSINGSRRRCCCRFASTTWAIIPGRARPRRMVGQGALEIRRLGRCALSPAGFRAVPGCVVRRSAYIAPGVVLMPSFVNLGAYVDKGTMIDTWATVGSCAQIGKNCHISGGAGIGGVLEPLQAGPVIIEDNCFIGARSEVAEGVIVREGAVLSMGVFIGASTKIVDRDSGEIFQGEVPSYAVVVPGSLPGKPRANGEATAGLSCAVIVKRVDEKTRAKTSINELLRD